MKEIKFVKNGFLPPDQLFQDELPGIRAIAFERLARDLHSLFGNKHDEITSAIMNQYGINRLEASSRAFYYYEQVRNIYASEATALIRPLQMELQEASNIEKQGDMNSAIRYYEKLADEGFPAILPYERLRIIYSKQGFYFEAIRVCKRYIAILEMIKHFWPEYPNLKSIPKYQDHIKKLTARMEMK